MDLTSLEATIKAKGIKKSRIADVLGISLNTLARKMNGENEFKCSELKKLAAELGMSDEDMARIFFSDYVA